MCAMHMRAQIGGASGCGSTAAGAAGPADARQVPRRARAKHTLLLRTQNRTMSSSAGAPRRTRGLERGITLDRGSGMYVHRCRVGRFKTVAQIYAALDAHEASLLHEAAVSSLTAAAPAKAAALC